MKGGGAAAGTPWHGEGEGGQGVLPRTVSLLTRKPAEEGICLEQGPAAQRAGDDGLIALEVVHGAGVELAICSGMGWG